jgi:hypothetical protein
MSFVNGKQADNGLGSIQVPDMAALSNDLAKEFAKSDAIRPAIVVKLGNPASSTTANDALYLASNPNYIYYTTPGDEASGVSFMPATVVPVEYRAPGQHVLVRRISNGFVYVGLAPTADVISSEGSIGIPDQSPVSTSQLDFAVLQPLVGSMQAVVKGAIYGDTAVVDVPTADFSASPLDTLAAAITIPTTANKAKGVLVQLNPSDSTLSYKQSAEFAASISLAEAYKQGLLPLRDTGKKRTGYVKLSYGIISLDNASVWPCPEFFPAISTGFTVSADSGSNLAIDSGDTLDIEGGANISTIASATDKVTIAVTGIGSTIQAYDADLAAIAALATTGFIARTGSGTVSTRTITGTAARIAVTDGNGVSGNPTLDLIATAVTPASYTSADITVDAYGRITAASNGSATTSGAILRDEKASNTAGGTSTSTTWNARNVNTELSDPDGIVTISSNKFTPIAGDYLINVLAGSGAASSSAHRLRLFNVTAGSSVEEGHSSQAIAGSRSTAFLACKFTANGTDEYRIDHYTSVGAATNGLGVATNDGSAEVYMTIELEKVA